MSKTTKALKKQAATAQSVARGTPRRLPFRPDDNLGHGVSSSGRSAEKEAQKEEIDALFCERKDVRGVNTFNRKTPEVALRKARELS
jgi:hypothetical protein